MHDNQSVVDGFNYVYDFVIKGLGANPIIDQDGYFPSNLTSLESRIEPIRIINNTIISTEKVYSNFGAHCCLDVNNACVLFECNQIHASKQRSGTNNGFVVYRISGAPSSIQILNNQCFGIKKLGTVSSQTGTYEDLRFLIRGNYFDGPINQFFPGVSNMYYVFDNNTCINGEDVIMFQELGGASNIEILNNIFQMAWNSSITSAAMLRFAAKEAPYIELNRLIITGNRLIGYGLSSITAKTDYSNRWTGTTEAIVGNSQVLV